MILSAIYIMTFLFKSVKNQDKKPDWQTDRKTDRVIHVDKGKIYGLFDLTHRQLLTDNTLLCFN